MNTVVLQTGDIILIHIDSWSDWLSMFRFRSWWTHAAVYYGGGKTVEMTDKNVRNLTFEKRYRNKKIQVIRFKWLTLHDRVSLRREALRLKHLKFDRLRLAIPMLPQFRKGRFWCTNFIDHLYKKATGKTINVQRLMQGRKGYLNEVHSEVIYDYRTV